MWFIYCCRYVPIGQGRWRGANDIATAVSVMSMTLQLKNYRKPALQRAVVRIMVMYVVLLESVEGGLIDRVPLYAISSLIAIFSLEAAFFIDAIRDLYEVSHFSVLKVAADNRLSLYTPSFSYS